MYQGSAKPRRSLWDYLKAARLNPYEWELVKEYRIALVIRHRASGVLKTIMK